MSYGLDLSITDQKLELIAGFRDSIANLGKKLGVVMVQFPHKDPQREAALELLRVLPDKIPYAFDFRKEVWDTPEFRDQLAQGGATLCWTDTTGEVPDELPPGPVAYVRLRVERYSEEQRAAWLDKLQKEAVERHVYVFVKHESGPANDPLGGVALARWLTQETS
jgi:uncharacterized protein YecE (DUF72 family)